MKTNIFINGEIIVKFYIHIHIPIIEKTFLCTAYHIQRQQLWRMHFISINFATVLFAFWFEVDSIVIELFHARRS